MPALPRRPRAHAVVRADEVIANQHGIIPVGDAADHLTIHPGPPVAALVVGAQRLGEAGGRQTEEGRREGATRPLRVQRIARLEVEGRLGRRRGRVIGHRRGGAQVRVCGLVGITSSLVLVRLLGYGSPSLQAGVARRMARREDRGPRDVGAQAEEECGHASDSHRKVCMGKGTRRVRYGGL